MIIGVGTDLVEVSRIGQSIEKYGQKFIDRVFTSDEQAQAESRKDQTRFYAMRFAAKEAAWKALSPGYSNGVAWHDLNITSNQDGKPELFFTNKAAEVFASMTENNGKTHLSLSDDGGMALAFVVLSAP